MSADDRCIHNASCENRTPCVFPSQVWHQYSPRRCQRVTRYTMLTYSGIMCNWKTIEQLLFTE